MAVEEVSELLFGTIDPEDQAAMEARFQQEERERQQLIAECMAEQGFEYTGVGR